jgi:6-phosphogluconolactonase
VKITWVVVDERYVPIDDPQSNAGMMQRTLFKHGMSKGHEFIRFKTELNDAARTAKEFESHWPRLYRDSLDLVILGVGDDGHTASLFPGSPLLQVTDRVAAEVFVPKLDQWRMTLTLPVIREAAARMILATGPKKKAILEGIRKGDVSYPIALVSTTDVEMNNWWFIDRAAEPAG